MYTEVTPAKGIQGPWIALKWHEVTMAVIMVHRGVPWCTTEVCLWQNATPGAARFAPSMEPGCGCTTFGLQIWRKNMEKPDNSWHILTCWTFHSSTHRQIWYLYTISIWEMVHVVAWFPSWPSPSPKFANMALSCSGRCASLPRSRKNWSLLPALRATSTVSANFSVQSSELQREWSAERKWYGRQGSRV